MNQLLKKNTFLVTTLVNHTLILTIKVVSEKFFLLTNAMLKDTHLLTCTHTKPHLTPIITEEGFESQESG